jgi:glycosyltransferase involved in cell wall biosynthesis
VHEVLEASTTFAPGDRTMARQATGMSGDPCVLWAGRLDANKDPLVALAAFERAAAAVPNARLWCCWGKAPLLDAVRQRVARSRVLRERVTLVGPRPHEEVELRLRAADYFVQTSHREGSGYALLESLACGTPALVTDIPASRRIVGDTACGAGSLTPVGDADALARALVHWSAGNRAAQRCAARARFEQALTFEVVGRELRAAYEAVAARPAR